MFIASLLSLLGAGSAAPSCAAVPGAAPLLAMRERRTLIFGELHGTAEIPPLFADLVCQAAAQGPVIVGLEMPESSQTALDAWLASGGGREARAALLRDSFWRFGDGRASEAMLALLERLRALRAAGRSIRLLAFVPSIGPAATQTPYEQAMAANWSRALAAAPGARLLVLVGSVHSRIARYRDFDPAAMHLPRAGILTFAPLPVGGSAYNCQPSGCGPNPAGPVPSNMPGRGLIPTPPEARAVMAYDYLYAPGTSFTPSPPAVPAPRPTRVRPPGS
jgi:hypothetical protein